VVEVHFIKSHDAGPGSCRVPAGWPGGGAAPMLGGTHGRVLLLLLLPCRRCEALPATERRRDHAGSHLVDLRALFIFLS